MGCNLKSNIITLNAKQGVLTQRHYENPHFVINAGHRNRVCNKKKVSVTVNHMECLHTGSQVTVLALNNQSEG